MVFPNRTVSISIVIFFYFFQGILIDTRSEQELTKTQILHSSLCVAGHAYVTAASLYHFVEDIVWVRDRVSLYQNFSITIYVIGCFWAVASNILERKKINRYLREMLHLKQTLRDMKLDVQRSRKIKTLKLVFMSLWALATILTVYETSFFFVEANLFSFQRGLAVAAFTVFRIPILFFSWMILFNVMVAYILQYEFAGVIAKEMSEQDPLTIFTIVQPACEPPSFIPSPEEIYQPPQPYRVHTWLRYHKILTMMSREKDFIYETNRRYYFHLAWILLLSMCYLPSVVFCDTKIIGTKVLSNSLHLLSILLTFCSLTVPIFMTHWARYRLELLAKLIMRERYSTKDSRTKKVLMSFVRSVQDDFPHSPCVLFAFEPSFLIVMQNVLILVITTLFVPN